MRFSFSAEQEEFRATLRRALEARSPTKEVRRLMATDDGLRPRRLAAAQPGARPHRHPHPRGLWRPGLRLRRARHRAGGDGPQPALRAVLLDRRWPPPRSSMPARRSRRRRCCPASPTAPVTATLAFQEENGSIDAAGIAMTRDRQTKLDGTKSFVLDGHTADLIVVVARQPGTQGRRRPLLLHRRRQRAGPDAAQAQDHGRDAQARAPHLQGRRGPAARRRGRGRRRPSPRPCSRRSSASPTRWSAAPTGCARTRSSTSRCACSSAARSPRSRPPRTRRPTCWPMSSWRSRRPTTPRRRSTRATTTCRRWRRSPRRQASEAYLQTAIHAVQMHGGIGFTWDNDTHLWFKRAKSSEILFGDANEHREKMMQAWAH